MPLLGGGGGTYVLFARKKLKVQELLSLLECGNPEYVPSSTLTSFVFIMSRLKQKIQFSFISVFN